MFENVEHNCDLKGKSEQYYKTNIESPQTKIKTKSKAVTTKNNENEPNSRSPMLSHMWHLS